jgi:hypothetical protein
MHSLPAAPGVTLAYTGPPKAAIQLDMSHKNARPRVTVDTMAYENYVSVSGPLLPSQSRLLLSLHSNVYAKTP